MSVNTPLAEPPSATDASTSIESVDVSTSVTVTSDEAEPRSLDAAIVATWSPSTMLSVTPETVTVAEVVPAGMVTVPATVASPESLDVSVTTVSTSRAMSNDTARSTEPPSATDAVAGVIDNTATSLSVTVIEVLSSFKLLVASTSTRISPSSIASSTPIAVKFAVV